MTTATKQLPMMEIVISFTKSGHFLIHFFQNFRVPLKIKYCLFMSKWCHSNVDVFQSNISPKSHTHGDTKYKIFVLCDTKGLIHSFYINSTWEPDIGASGNIVPKLAQVIPSAVNHLLYFDNWFSTLNLFVALVNKRIPALATVQQNHLQGCSFSAETDIKKKERGTFKEKKIVVVNVEIRAVKLFDRSFSVLLPVPSLLHRKMK